jgi:hypothetical protein
MPKRIKKWLERKILGEWFVITKDIEKTINSFNSKPEHSVYADGICRYCHMDIINHGPECKKGKLDG